MNSHSIVPIVTADDLRALRAFYVDGLGFELSYDHDFYLGVRAGPKGSAELGFMRTDADAPTPFGGKGLTLAITVDDADRECARLRARGVRIVAEPSDKPWGARSFQVQDPTGVVILISHPIPPAVEFASAAR